ncbi:hypothetical protein D3C85_1098870 [compost metagenome]
MLEQLAVQIAEIVGDAERGFIVVVFGQNHAEVVVAHVRGKVVPCNALDAFVVFLVDDVCLQYLDQRKNNAAAFGADVHFRGNDLEFDRVAIPRRVVPMRQAIEAPVDHPQGVAQILLATGSPGQIGEVRGDARVVRWLVIFIEADALDAECERVAHCGFVR